ncbi:unnamed protein product [Symbiodinium natans]|uniref:Uncharacterized protein n=1 Tax=Symbiodinium natans TaxID=878477 RepID=A0A812PJ96_9DINO|nr:unnamed protein product [Symbiodinium natans]
MAVMQPHQLNCERRRFGWLAMAAATVAMVTCFGPGSTKSFVTGYTVSGAAPDCSPVAMEAKRQRTWPIKFRQNAEYLARHPPPAMTEKKRKRRLLYINLFRRQDEMLCEKYIFNDPRDDRWQWDVDKTRQFLDEEKTMVDDIKKKKLTSRDDLGLPLPPTDLKIKAIAKIQRSTAAQASKQEADKANKEEGKPRAKKKSQMNQEVDLGNVDVEFMNYKGLVMTRKQKAAFAARAAKNKKQGRR